jgi:glucose-6-phosphate isomerase
VDLAGNLVETGSTPVRAVGVTDQHSQLQLYSEGPHDKLITFWSVAKFQHSLEIPAAFEEFEGMGYLGGRSLSELFKAEETATAFNLMKAGRPNLTLGLPEVNPFTVGQLIYLVEGGKQTACGLLGRPGYEAYRQEVSEAAPKLSEYMVK